MVKWSHKTLCEILFMIGFSGKRHWEREMEKLTHMRRDGRGGLR